MPRYVSPPNQAALNARALVARDFLWIVARNRSTGAPESVGFWSDVGNISASVRNPDTGTVNTRTWYGSGTLIRISDIPLVSNLTVQTITIDMSQLDDLVEQAVRGYDCSQARVEVYRGLLDPNTRQLVDAAECLFVGFVDEISIDTPAENEEGSVVLTCTSHTQEMTRSNPSTRSHEDQLLRLWSDNFFQDAATVGEWELFWGRIKGKVGGGAGAGGAPAGASLTGKLMGAAPGVSAPSLGGALGWMPALPNVSGMPSSGGVPLPSGNFGGIPKR